MKNGYSQLIQSKYFITDFNSAIFDGPVRIYFAQDQESVALKIYFHVQNRFANEIKKLKSPINGDPFSLFILIYPTADSFSNCFGTAENMVVTEWDNDIVLGLNHCWSGVDFDLFDSQFQSAYQKWLGQVKKIKYDEITV